VFVLVYEVELHVGAAQSLKDKRQVLKSILEGARRRYGVSASEIGFQDQWQRARLGFAVVASSVSQATEIIDDVDRFVWSRPDLDVLSTDRRWLE
jgi:uncharacterized protein YlxP (DUF503 family)